VQNWAADVIAVLCQAHAAVEAARARGDTVLDQQVLDDLRERYDTAVKSGIIHNRLRDWRGAKAAKGHQAVSGYWHSLGTLGRWCRLRSYLETAAAHGVTVLDAIASAIAAKPWLPPLPEIADASPGHPVNGHAAPPPYRSSALLC
jgi:transposase